MYTDIENALQTIEGELIIQADAGMIGLELIDREGEVMFTVHAESIEQALLACESWIATEVMERESA